GRGVGEDVGPLDDGPAVDVAEGVNVKLGPVQVENEAHLAGRGGGGPAGVGGHVDGVIACTGDVILGDPEATVGGRDDGRPLDEVDLGGDGRARAAQPRLVVGEALGDGVGGGQLVALVGDGGDVGVRPGDPEDHVRTGVHDIVITRRGDAE